MFNIKIKRDDIYKNKKKIQTKLMKIKKMDQCDAVRLVFSVFLVLVKLLYFFFPSSNFAIEIFIEGILANIEKWNKNIKIKHKFWGLKKWKLLHFFSLSAVITFSERHNLLLLNFLLRQRWKWHHHQNIHACRWW